MKDKFKKKVILCGLGIIGVFGGTTVLVCLNVLSAVAFVLAVMACMPLFKYIWEYVEYLRRDPFRILAKYLPEAGFKVEETEWNDDHTKVTYTGTYKDEYLYIEAQYGSAFVTIYCHPWQLVSPTDPRMPQIMEAINESNINFPFVNVILTEPNNMDMRKIINVCNTVIPTFNPHSFLECAFSEILNRRVTVINAFNKERPYMYARRGPVGFNVASTPDSDEEAEVPAAKNNGEVKN